MASSKYRESMGRSPRRATRSRKLREPISPPCRKPAASIGTSHRAKGKAISSRKCPWTKRTIPKRRRNCWSSSQRLPMSASRSRPSRRNLPAASIKAWITSATFRSLRSKFESDLAVIAYAIRAYGLPDNLKLSVHSGSDKFSIYEPIRKALPKFNAGLHLKTAGTTWLEELIGLAEAGRPRSRAGQRDLRRSVGARRRTLRALRFSDRYRFPEAAEAGHGRCMDQRTIHRRHAPRRNESALR